MLACGEGAVLSGRPAGWLWRLLKGPAPAPEVAAPTERRVKGIRTTRARRAKREATKCCGVPVTSVARTLVDLAAVLDETELSRACHEAWEQDRRREREARGRGDEFRRYTYGDVFESPRLMMAELRTLLEPQRPAPVS